MSTPRSRLLAATFGSLAPLLLGTGLFVHWKAGVVADELVDPPFYKVQPLARVEATYAELAAGGQGDPGGTWSSREVQGLQLWTLRRKTPARGHVLLLHGFGDDRWGTSPALRWFPREDVSIFTYRRRDDALRSGEPVPPVTFGALEAEEVVKAVHQLESEGVPRHRILLMGRSLGASVGLLALARLEAEGGPLGGIIWEGAPLSSRDFAERLVRGPRDRWWHPGIAPLVGWLASHRAARRGAYALDATSPLVALQGRVLDTPSLAFMATQDRLAPLPGQRTLARAFRNGRSEDVETWHLNCAPLLGSRYAELIREACDRWL